jgi:hypothetical protein
MTTNHQTTTPVLTVHEATVPPLRPEVREVALTTLVLDPTIQPRLHRNAAKVADYAALYQDGVDLGPLTVYQDGAICYVVDGFHRAEAAWQSGKPTLPAVVHTGSRREAQLAAMGCNKHGQPYTQDDKRRNVHLMVSDGEWGTWSDRRIARHCGVSNSFVGKLRRSLCSEHSDPSSARTYVTRWGTEATMHTAAIGQRGPDGLPSPFAAADLGWLTEPLKLLGEFRLFEPWWQLQEALPGLTHRMTATLVSRLVAADILAVHDYGPDIGQYYSYIPEAGETMPDWHSWHSRLPRWRVPCAPVPDTEEAP